MKYDIGDIIRLQSGLHVMIVDYDGAEEKDIPHYRVSFLHDGSSTLYNVIYVHQTTTLVQKAKR